jgi:hypothetical protein
MKKGLLALLSLSLLVALPACYKDKEDKGGKKEMSKKEGKKKEKKEKGSKKETKKDGKKDDKHHKATETKKHHEKHTRKTNGGMEETETTTKKSYSSRY